MNQDLLRVRVARKTAEAVGITSFELVADDGEELPSFGAGAHIDVHLPGGMVRQYSLCNEPSESHRYLIAVLREPAGRGGSQAMHEAVHEGATLSISAPKNHFPLARDARRSILLAGGIGVTPILCMAERLAILGANFEMHYCARSVERMAFRERITAASFARRVAMHFDDGNAEQKLDMAKLLSNPVTGTHLYVCGPKGFMDAALATARAHQWPELQLHYEFFAADPHKSGADSAFQIQLASSGRIVQVAGDQTAVQALARAGIEVQTSCEQGVCGTCLTRVLQGVPEHRDLYLTQEEKAANDQFLPCCSRSKSPILVVDL